LLQNQPKKKKNLKFGKNQEENENRPRKTPGIWKIFACTQNASVF
jgi:hypothetical protein